MQGTSGTEILAASRSDESHMMDDLNLRQLQCPQGEHQSSSQLCCLNSADENNGMPSLVLFGQGLSSLVLFRRGLDDLAH